MKKFSIILSSFILIITLTTFNPNNLNSGLVFLSIKEIEINDLKFLEKKKIQKLAYNELIGSSLFILDKKKINLILNNSELVDYIKLRKRYPSKLKIIIYEKEPVAILNNKKKTFYITKEGEEIKFFKNPRLEGLPNIFGKKNNFLQIYEILDELNFPISEIKSFYYFDIGRWDIILKDNRVIKLPVKNFSKSLKNYLELNKKINFEKYSIFDYRIQDQLILN